MIYFWRTEVEEVLRLRLSPLTKNVRNFSHIVRVEGYDTFLMRGTKGALYTTGRWRSGDRIHGLRPEYAAKLMDALVKIGAISEEAATAYTKEAEALAEQRSKAYGAQMVSTYAREIGLKLTKAQIKKLDSM